MTIFTNKQIIKEARACVKNINKNQKLGISYRWGLYFAEFILNPTLKEFKKIEGIKDSPAPRGNHISRQINQNDYKQLAKDYIKFCKSKHNGIYRFPNFLTYKQLHIRPRLACAFFANIIVYYDEHGKLPAKQNINSKWFVKPSETGNKVYDYFVQKTGKKPQTVDETLAYVSNEMVYEGYSDDKYSNKEVMDKKKGNCVDLLQWLMNMAKAEGYETKCIHVQCRTSKIGHVFGKFKHNKHTGGKWITRDPAAVAGGHDIRNVWCENGYLLDTDPSWFNENLNR